jgi:outer membrane receptor for ferrienterochelin and colicin
MTVSPHCADVPSPVLTRRRTRQPLALCLALAAAFPIPVHAADDLTSLSLEQLLDVTIVGASKYEQKQADVAAAVSVITRREIRAYGWHTLDEALASLPGVHTSYDRQNVQFGTRGFGLPGDFNTRVLVLVDGNRVNETTYDSGLVGRSFPVDMDLIERIEFIPGPGGAVYGQNAMFGVVNVITRRGADVGGTELAMSVQSPQARGEGRASWGALLDNGADLLLSVSGLRARGQDRWMDYGASGIAGVAAGMDAARGAQLFGRIARGPWALEHVESKQRKDDPTGSYFSDPLRPGQYQSFSVSMTQLQYEDSFLSDTLQVSARLFRGSIHLRTRLSYEPLQFVTDTRSQRHGAELRLLSTALAGHKLLAGFEVQYSPRADQASTAIPADPALDFVIHSPGHRAGVFAQDEWRLSDTVAATLGVRVDRNNVTGTKTSPRAALIWQASPATTWKALYGRAYRAPNAYERDYDDGYSQAANPALGAERIDTLEAVLDHRIGRDLTLRASVYRWAMHDIISARIDPLNGIVQYRSGERVDARGLELSADKTWRSGARLRSSVSLQDVADATGGGLLNSPRLLGKLNVSAPLAGLLVGYEWRYVSQRMGKDGIRLGGYAVSNLNLSTENLVPGLDIALGIYNLFDKRYAHPAAATNWQNAFEQDGRSVRVQIGFRY